MDKETKNKLEKILRNDHEMWYTCRLGKGINNFYRCSLVYVGDNGKVNRWFLAGTIKQIGLYKTNKNSEIVAYSVHDVYEHLCCEILGKRLSSANVRKF